jgi:hypothetical protein
MLVTIFNDEDPLRAIGGVFNLGVEFGAQLRTR